MKSKFSGILTLLLALFVQLTFAQEKTVSGMVLDDYSLPLPGATVLVKGTTTGTSTDFDGKYSIQANEGDVIVFSFVGYSTQEITVSSSNTINVTLQEDAESLDEVLIVGYGTSTLRSFTGSATQIEAEALDRKTVSNVSQALAGEASGVRVINTSGQPGEDATVRIRGFGSVNGNRDPLYVLDGVPYTGSINAINPTDIESTTILKDAAATAIYGSRGANGVIVINTKKGSRGKDEIELDIRTGQNFNGLPRYSTISSPEEYIGISWEALKNRGNAINGSGGEDYANQRLFSSSGINPAYNMWNVANGAELIDPATGLVRNGVTRKYNPENWEDYAFQASLRTEANLKISGGTDKTRYFTSFGYLNDNGYSINSDYKRYSVRANIEHKAKDWLSGSLNIGYTNSTANNGGQSEDSGSVFWFVDNIPSIYPLFLRDADGNTMPDPHYGGNIYDYGEGRGFGGLTNAIADAHNSISRSFVHNLNGSANIDISFNDDLKLINKFGWNYYNSDYTNQEGPFYGPSAGQNGSIFKRRTDIFSYNLLNMLTFKKKLDGHNFDALAAHEINDWNRQYLYGSKNYLTDPDGTDWNDAIIQTPMSSFNEGYSLESFFGQLNYNYNETYFLAGTIRRDGSSRFKKGNKWGTFYSFSGAWALSNEDFMSKQNIFTFLKLKASYGKIGDQGGVGFYPGLDLYSVGNLDDKPTLVFDSKGNPDLTWETSNQFQTGVEFSLGKYLDASVDYYIKDTENLIFDRQVGPSLGYAIIKVNDGSLRNKGLEFDLNAHLVKTKDFYLDLGINGEIASNELTRMPIDPATGEQKVLDIQGRYGRAVGHSIYDFYMREWAGVDSETGLGQWNQYYYDANNDGMVNSGEEIKSLTDYLAQYPDRAGNISKTTTTTYADATQKFIDKSIIPDVRGAVNLATGYKGFQLNVQFLYGIGGYAYDAVYAGLMDNDVIGGNNWHTDIRNRWQKPGDITDVPRLTSDLDPNVASTSTRFLTKADYLSLNNIRLAYNVSQDFVEKMGMSNFSVSLSGDNLGIWSKRAGFNPSSSETGLSDTYTYSPLTSVTLGLNVRF
ncbi:SusC/RagA family TonB-linked outer membrane protein [Pseudotamlana carrageenivorans]|uniref:SusC/RagA family TonB-linked outer membrane protein n=1 Tax=Pseudotamlana carrageenivorans TaxID=2069432 RepID=A0A2I7SFJ0_9FLAO|nr:SusC/RagA family TonB-linked outer membrane protein [Tamlana carrageenivorans]AUS04658.1 SusC/RagA family TonB-linked outer membrane protein [Tamlana carrageenivorans]